MSCSSPLPRSWGAKLGGGAFDLRLLIVLVANILVVGFAFMYNDVEDAADDALDAHKAKRNPISAGMISPRIGKAACVVVSGLVLGLYALLGGMTLLLGALCLALAFLYSWRVARLKAVPVADLLTHGLSLAGLQFLCAYFAFDRGKPYSWLFFVFVVLISVYGLLGVRWTKVVMVGSLVAAFAVLAIFLALEMIPLWLLSVPLIVAPMLFAESLWRLVRGEMSVVDEREAMHEPAVLLGLLTCVVWFVADAMPNVRLF
jgi:1,4-dihydroxy-2-naphthoate octaprenyltransferase